MSTDLVTVTPKEYPALDPNNPVLARLKTSLGEELSATDYPRISTPTGKNPAWLLPNGKPAKSFEAVLVFSKPHNFRWDPEAAIGEAPPLCASHDGITGQGNPGGACSICPHNQWGTGKEGRGKACDQRRLCVLLLPDFPLPVTYSASRTSRPVLKSYLAQLVFRNVNYWHCVTRFGLSEANGAKGAYGKVAPEFVAPLNAASCKQMDAVRAKYGELFARFQPPPEETSGE